MSSSRHSKQDSKPNLSNNNPLVSKLFINELSSSNLDRFSQFLAEQSNNQDEENHWAHASPKRPHIYDANQFQDRPSNGSGRHEVSPKHKNNLRNESFANTISFVGNVVGNNSLELCSISPIATKDPTVSALTHAVMTSPQPTIKVPEATTKLLPNILIAKANSCPDAVISSTFGEVQGRFKKQAKPTMAEAREINKEEEECLYNFAFFNSEDKYIQENSTTLMNDLLDALALKKAEYEKSKIKSLSFLWTSATPLQKIKKLIEDIKNIQAGNAPELKKLELAIQILNQAIQSDKDLKDIHTKYYSEYRGIFLRLTMTLDKLPRYLAAQEEALDAVLTKYLAARPGSENASNLRNEMFDLENLIPQLKELMDTMNQYNSVIKMEKIPGIKLHLGSSDQ